MTSSLQFLEYIDQIWAMELKMCQNYTKIYTQLTHPEYREAFRKMAEQEMEHMTQVQKLRSLWNPQ